MIRADESTDIFSLTLRFFPVLSVFEYLYDMIKAIFFDIDGTLVSFQTHTVPEPTREALIHLRRQGIKLFIATGRPLAQINNLGDLVFDGYITLNGAYCLRGDGTVISRRPIPRSNVEALIRYQDQHPFPCICVSEHDISINFVDDAVSKLSQLVAVAPPPIKSLEEASRQAILQMSIYVDREREEELIRDVLPDCESSRWNPLFTDLNRKGVDKASGIDQILDYYGLSLEESMAFGDGGNDIAMLRHAAIGIAMGNAMDEVKVHADYVTDSVDGLGIPNALRHFGLL